MKILVTGARGFVGKNLVLALKNIKEGKDKTKPEINVEEIFEYDIGNEDRLEEYCGKCDFVFNLAGVNRPKEKREFTEGNVEFGEKLLKTLKEKGSRAPVMQSSSVQATLSGRFEGSEYGKSKKSGEEVFFRYGKETGVPVYVFRFPNIFGKFCRPNYNSAVATFCYNTANDLPITVNDRNTELELLYIDDLVEGMMNLLSGKVCYCTYEGTEAKDFYGDVGKKEGIFCRVPVTHRVTLGEIADLLEEFKKQPETLMMPKIPEGSFAKKLYSTYLSYLPEEKICFDLKMNEDSRGSFTELMRTGDCGQFSINVSKPGITKGNHWHNRKWEFFIVVSGHALIEERCIESDKVLKFEVSGDRLQAVHMLPGYTHNITNLSETENLVTVMWVNECFNPDNPDTFFEIV